MEFSLVTTGKLTIGASNFDARPMSYIDNSATGFPSKRLGYEPDLARAVCAQLELEPVWLNLPMAEFYAALDAGDCDVVWFNQAITVNRRVVANFSQPYGLFDEAVLVNADSSINSPEDLAGKRVGGLADSTNLELAETFANAKLIPFVGSDRVLPQMLAALRQREIDALVDDELVLITAAEADASLRVAFTVPTQREFAIAVRDENLRHALDDALKFLIANGSLEKLWAQWIRWKPFPL